MLPLLALLLACSTETPATPPASPGSTLLPPTLAPGATPAAAPMQAAPMQATPTAAGVTGTVAETMDAGGYTYLRLTTTTGDKWAAVTEAKVAVGDTVTIVNATVMHNFASPTLKRTFDEILFGALGTAGAAPAAMPAPTPAADVAVRADIPRAEGATGRTVAEVFAQRKDLAGKKVSVRGQVVKYNDHIMNKNWVHLRDGSGTAEAKDNDLAVTTSQDVAVGDVVLVTGTLAADKDFGAGYAYPAIIEDATVAK